MRACLVLALALSVALNIFQVLTRQEVQLFAKATTLAVAPPPGLSSSSGPGGGGGGATAPLSSARALPRANSPKARADDGHGHAQAALVPAPGPTLAKEWLLVLGVISAEQLPAVGGVGDPKLHAGDQQARARRARARAYYQRLRVAEILVKFFVDGAWLRNQTQPEPDDVVGIPSSGKYALHLCGGWGHADLPGTCTTKEARLMSKARGWWRVARQWPARYYGQTDDDCVIDLPRLAHLVQAMPRRDVYAGKLFYASINGTATDQIPLRACFTDHGPKAALGTKTFFPNCKPTRGPLPYMNGPLIVLSEDVSTWLLDSSAQPLHSFETTAHQTDAQLGWELSFHPSLSLVDLGFILGGAYTSNNFRAHPSDPIMGSYAHPTKEHPAGIVAHKVSNQHDFDLVTAQQQKDRAEEPKPLAVQCSALRGEERERFCPGGASRFTCSKWSAQLAEVDAFPPELQGWRLCTSPREAAAAAAEAKAQERFFEAANMSSVLGAAERWLAVARPGVCAATTGPGDCEHGTKGSFKDAGLDQVRSWDQLALRCKWLCEGCARCRHISASLAFKDCSWFHDCSLDALSSAAPGFKSAPADARSLEHLQKMSA